MSSTATKINRLVYYWEDFHSKNLKESSVGRKGLSLFQLKDMDIPIPEFFVLSSRIYDKFVSQTLLKNSEKLLEGGKNPEDSEVLQSFLKSEFDDEVVEELLSAYTRLSGFTDAWVSVRSSVVFPSSPEVSFSGVFSTELNIRGLKNLIDSIKRIYSSLYTDDVVAYASSKGINLADVKLSVVVQKMIQAEVSGVAFTVDPITQDSTKLSIEAIFGLGDTISLGELTPDTYLLEKKELNVIEKHIAPQEWMKVRMLSGSRGSSGVERIKISNNWSHRQKLEDKYLKEISKIALIVENKLRQAQNIEWVLAGGKVWVLQSKDLYERTAESTLTVVDSRDFDTLAEVLKLSIDKYSGLGMIESKAVEHAKRIVQSNKHEYDSVTAKLIGIAKKKTSQTAKVESSSLASVKEDLLVSGIGASFGQIVGRAVVLEKDKEIQISKNDILVIREYGSEMESLIVHAGGVVMDTGGLTSDTSILCREFDIPAVVGTQKGSLLIKDGDIIRLDGNTGSVYKEKGKEMKEAFNAPKTESVHPVVEAYREENLSGVDLLKSNDIEVKDESKSVSELKIPKDFSLSPSATKVFINPTAKPSELIDYVGNAHGLVYIDLDRLMINQGRHLLAFVEDKKYVQYSKEISEKICEYIDLAQGNQVLLSIGSSTVGEFRALTRGKDFEDKELEDSVYGLAHYVNNRELLRRVLMIVRRVRNVYKKRNMDIAIHSPMNGSLMNDFKKSVSAAGLRRTSTFKIFAVIDSPTEVILADEILDTKIDGLVLNMPRVVRVMQGFDMNDLKAKYNLGVNSAFKIVDAISDTTRNTPKQLIVMAENSKDLIKYCVQTGVYGISVSYQDIKESRKLVSDEEARVILSKR
ncbi:MAG: PEP/pyruvate-binding domain-containing protein [Candidatus Dojkabacteria bacterium]|jgi:pyruvate,water dikinase|nr:PEP/pyruvate-binding domain-containing protein [Candidatus Dojkabacteria bacterium]